MKIIVPMAGIGKRMRPHTLSVPKPLLPVAGKPIVQILVEDISKMSNEPIDEVAFVVGNFGKEIEDQLINIAGNVGAKGTIYYQHEALGTAHAILCAADSLSGKTTVAFADTLFVTDFNVNESVDGIIWVRKVDDPAAFGVVKTDDKGIITQFVEKSPVFVSNLAIIGIYYFKNGEYLREELQYVIDNRIKDKGEYQLTSVLENMKNKGKKLLAGNVNEWLDCGNKDATVYTNRRILELNKNNGKSSKKFENQNGIIIEPSYIGENVKIINSTVGPHASVGNNTIIENSKVVNSIIQTNTRIISANISNSMIGNYVKYTGEGKDGKAKDMSIGDYTVIN